MSVEDGQAQTAAVEDRLATAAAAGDDTAFFTALRSARFFAPVHMAGVQSRFLLLDVDSQQHVAVFTSVELASSAITMYAGGTARWDTPEYSVEQLVKTFHEGDVRLLLNPGTATHRSFTVSELIERWRSAGLRVTAPRKRRGSIKAGLTMLVFALIALLSSGQSSSGQVMCGSQIMSPDDTCITVSSGESRSERDYEETRSAQGRSATVTLVLGSVLGIAGLYMLVARVVTAVPRRE